MLVNAELDATVGPILKRRADAAGVVITNTDGDEPGVTMNLLRYVRTIGLEPVLVGNIKGFIDPHRTPGDPGAFAESVGQGPKMITSFADGTKLSMEATIVANASGFGVAQRGMNGHQCEHVNDVLGFFDAGGAPVRAGSSTTCSARSRARGRSSSATPSVPVAGAVPEVLQDGRRAVLRLLHAVAPAAGRGAV